MSINQCTLLPGRGKIHKSFHPWVFSGAIATPPISVDPLLPVQVFDADGTTLGWAQHNPNSKIRLRFLSFGAGPEPDQDWYKQTLVDALERRTELQGTKTTVIRLVFSESDSLPGLIIDRLGDVLVVQFLSAGADVLRPMFIQLLRELAPAHIPQPFDLKAIVERSDGDGRRMEGLPLSNGVLWGTLPEVHTVRENGIEFLVDSDSQKTGFYADQRENRDIVSRWAKGRSVLDVCCYTGGFSAYAAAHGATSITLLDSSAPALAMAIKNIALQSIKQEIPVETLDKDAFRELRKLAEDKRRYDLIILDPPKLAPTRASLTKAATAYKDLNLNAMRLLGPGGLLATFSCSGLVSSEDLRTWISWAAKDLRRRAHIVEQFGQAACHPVPLHFPEAHYLKGFLIRMID